MAAGALRPLRSSSPSPPSPAGSPVACVFLSVILGGAALLAALCATALATASSAITGSSWRSGPLGRGEDFRFEAVLDGTGAPGGRRSAKRSDGRGEEGRVRDPDSRMCSPGPGSAHLMLCTPALMLAGAWVVSNIRPVRSAEGKPLAGATPLTCVLSPHWRAASRSYSHPSARPAATLHRWADAIDALRSGTLGPFLDSRLAASPHQPAFFWETPPLSLSHLTRPFEFVTLAAPHLVSVNPDGSAFALHHKAAAPCDVATFGNLGGDAILVSPCPPSTRDAAGTLVGSMHSPSHGHLAAFVRYADASQREAFWRAVGEAAWQAARRSSPTWISTEGSGVPWLHVRLDSRPKYFHHHAYTKA